MMRCLARPNWTVVVSMAFVGYVLNSMWTLASLFMPPTCSDDTPNRILSHLASKPQLQLLLFTSSKKMISDEQDLQLLDRWEDVQAEEPQQRVVQVTLPSRTRQRAGSLYLHAFLCPTGAQWRQSWLSDSATYASSQLVKLQLPAADSFNLLGSEKSIDGAADAPRPTSDTRQTSHKSTNKRSGSESAGEVPHRRSVVPLLFLSETVGLPRHALPPDIGAMLLHRLSKRGRYLPILHADGLTSRSVDLVRIDEPPGTAFNVTVTLTPVSLGRLRLWMQFELGMRSMRQLGFTEKDLDEVKGIFADTNLYLLLVTMFVASMHLLFDFLAFKNDVQFWRGRGSFAGISSRTVVWRAFSQFVILLYLMDEQTSYLVIVPMAIGTVIEVWKVFRAFRVRVLLANGWRPCLQFGTRTGAEQRTAQLDSQSMRYLSYLLYPLCVAGAGYSLVYTPHKSWYSWCLQSVVNGVYAFGFLFMLPQLFVNYKLKSVAHLPWRALMYKAFNTFIDDLFAFIITMPTAHRVACFRDDLVFVGYVAQRWMYPVDPKRQQDSAEGFSEHVQLDEQPAEDSVSKKRQ